MKQTTQFIKIAKQFTDEAKGNWVYKPYRKNPRSMSIIELEAKFDTKLSKKLLKEMLNKEDE